MVKQKDMELLECFKEFDEQEPISKQFSNEDLRNLAYNNGSKNVEIPKKIQAYKRLLAKAQENLQERFKAFGLSVADLKFDYTFSAGSPKPVLLTFEAKTKEGATFLNVNINSDVQKQLKFPSLENYAIISALVYKKVSDKNLIKFEANEQKYVQNPKNLSLSSNENGDLVQQRNSAKFLMTAYLKSFLSKALNVEFEPGQLNFVVDAITEDLLSSMTPKEISRVSSFFFKMESLDREFLKDSKNYVAIENARTGKILESTKKFGDLALDKDADYSDAKALSAEEQFLALSTAFIGRTDKVKQALEGGFSTDNAKLVDFCTEYAHQFMSSNNLEDIPIKFMDAGDECCAYVNEGGENHYIRINLAAKELKGGNITELVMTLSHELTHAVDSTLNKVSGRGNGLIGSMNESTSAFNRENLPRNCRKEACDLLQETQKYCYQLDPNEMHGRLGEISALKFLRGLYENDEVMQSQMQQSITAYNKYQKRTIEYAEGLPEKIADFKRRLDALGISPSSNEYKMIEKRIDYLKSLGNIDVSAERFSIGEAKEILEQSTFRSAKTASSKRTEENLLEEAARSNE